MVRTILFDLDGTLLPMDQDVFLQDYFGRLTSRLAQHGYDPKRLMKAVWAGTEAMVRNNGIVTNEEVFWRCMRQIFGQGIMNDVPVFEDFYMTEFPLVRQSCGFNPRAKELIDVLKNEGYRLILATNPLFPAVATRQRIRWAGLSPEDFELVTTYENSRFCKPNPDYYRDILKTIGAEASECMMIGNDVAEDMVAKRLGMEEYLLTDCLINKTGENIDHYRHGSMEALLGFVRETKICL